MNHICTAPSMDKLMQNKFILHQKPLQTLSPCKISFSPSPGVQLAARNAPKTQRQQQLPPLQHMDPASTFHWWPGECHD